MDSFSTNSIARILQSIVSIPTCQVQEIQVFSFSVSPIFSHISIFMDALTVQFNFIQEMERFQRAHERTKKGAFCPICFGTQLRINLQYSPSFKLSASII